MALQLQGNSGTVLEVDGTTFRAGRVTQRPPDYGALGMYRASHLSGTMAAGLAADAEVWQFRWADATRLCLLTRVTLDGMGGSATAFTAGFAKFDLLMARSWSVDGSGGTAMTLTGHNQKLRTSMGTTILNSSPVGAIRGSSTAALTAGTKTLDAQPLGVYPVTIGTAVSVQYATVVHLHLTDGVYSHPVVLAQNEGVVMRATVPATGTWQFGVTVEWAEVLAF